MKKHRNPRPRLSPAPTFDIPSALDLLREVIGRTDTLLYATEQHFERFGWRCMDGDEDDGQLPLEHLAHLLSAARESAISAVSLGGVIVAELARRASR